MESRNPLLKIEKFSDFKLCKILLQSVVDSKFYIWKSGLNFNTNRQDLVLLAHTQYIRYMV